MPANVHGLFINSVTPLLSVLFKGKSLWYDRASHVNKGPPWQELSVGMRLVCCECVSQLAAPGTLWEDYILEWVCWHIPSCRGCSFPPGKQGRLYPLPESWPLLRCLPSDQIDRLLQGQCRTVSTHPFHMLCSCLEMKLDKGMASSCSH